MPSATLEVAKREFLEHVLSWRFVIALALSTLILVTSVVALTATYREDLDRYQVQQDAAGAVFGPHATSEVHRHLGKPNLLSIFVGGPGDELRNKYADRNSFVLSSSPAQPGSSSPTNTQFGPLDLGFVAAVVMTFMAILFSFDAISGEKERGTLKLVLANPVAKDAILLGKYLGGVATLVSALAVAVVAALAALSLRGVTLGADAAARLAIIGLFAILLLSAVYLVGLVVSSLSRRSSTSLLVLTMLWLVLVFGTGNVAAVVAKEVATTTSNSELQEQERANFDATEAEAIAIGEEYSALFLQKQQRNLTAAEEARMAELEAQRQAAYARGEERRKAIHEAAIRQLDGQLELAEGIASVSVVDSFRSLATMLARSDYWTYRDLTAAAAEYQKEVDKAYAEWLEANPPQRFSDGGISVDGGPSPSVISWVSSPGNTFESPRMQYEPPSVSSQLSSPPAMRAVAALVAYNLGAFLAAYLAFLRYDVR